MKIRNGFVSNSSSSSFVISKDKLTDLQILLIVDHKNSAKMFKEQNENVYFGNIDDSDLWNIRNTDDTIEGDVFMDNFSMYDFLKYIGIDMDNVKWNY